MSKIFKDKYLNSIALTILLITVISSSFVFMTVQPVTKNIPIVALGKEKISTELKGVLRDANGNIKASFTKPDDLITKQFIDFLGTFFTGVYATEQTLVMKNDANTDKTFKIWSETSTVTGTYCDSVTGTSRKGGIIGIGTGTTAPARSNYALETKVESYADITTIPTWDTSTGIVSATASITITGSRTITEAVIGVRWIDSSSTEQVIIFAHDTFAGVSCVATDVFSLTYAFTLSSGFTNNFGYYLKDMFTSIADGSTLITTYKDYTNGNSALYFMRTSITSTWVSQPSMSVTGTGRISMGTSSTALARTDYKCGTLVENYVAPVTIIDTTGFYINGIIFSNTARTIKEVSAGVYNGGYITMIHLLTGDVSLNAKDALVVKIRVDM